MLELTEAELSKLMHVYAKATPVDGTEDALWGKLCAERDRLTAAAKWCAERDAKAAQRDANREYALHDMQPGDIVEVTAVGYTGSGRNRHQVEVTRRMRVIEARVGTGGRWGDSKIVTIEGIVLTKSGAPHKTLNDRVINGVPGGRYRYESGIRPVDVRLIERPAKTEAQA